MSYINLIDKTYIITKNRLKPTTTDADIVQFYNDNWKKINPSPAFNTIYFLENNPIDENNLKVSALEYFWKHCVELNLNPNPLFNTKYYLTNNPDIRSANINPLYHYLSHGYIESRSPHLLFDKNYLIKQLAKTQDDFNEQENYYLLYLNGDYSEISSSPYFDNDYYINQLDVKVDQVPIMHYATYGEEYHYLPNPLVSKLDFEKKHYSSRLERLIEDKNLKYYETSIWFNPKWYKQTYLPTYEFINPLKHYLMFGLKEGKQPTSVFFPTVYDKIVNRKDVTKLTALSSLISRIEKDDISINYDTSNPEVSIVILNWNKSITTAQCVNHIHSFTTNNISFEIVVVDNGSNFNEFIKLQEYCGKKADIIRLTSNKFFGEANNIGVEASKGKYTVLLNNDAFVSDNWLSPLLNEIKSNDDIGLVGPKFLFPDGKLQEAGGIMSACGQGIQIGKFLDSNAPAFQIKREVDYCSAAAVICRKADFLKLLGFDLIYEPAYYEDGDFCMKIKRNGKRIIYNPESTVYHVENHTSKDENIGFSFNSLVSVNKSKFVNRWSEFIAMGFPVDTSKVTNFTYSQNKSRDLPTAVLYTPYNVMPGGGEKYLLTIGEALTKKYKVYLSTPEKISRIRLLTVGNELNIEVNEITTIDYNQLLKMNIDLLVVMGNEIFPSVPPVGKKNIYHCQFPFKLQPGQENNINYLNGFDQIIVNSKFTQFHVRKQLHNLSLPEKQVNILYPPINNITHTEDKVFGNTINFLHVGRFFTGGHQKKQDVIIEAFKELVEKMPNKEFSLTLAGAVSSEQSHINYLEQLRDDAKDHNITFLINPTNDQLENRYRNSHIYLHATGYGADDTKDPEIFEHFGITVVEAALYNNHVFAFNGGGPKEILSHFPQIGETYTSIENLIIQIEDFLNTTKLISHSEVIGNILEKYSESKFHDNLYRLIN
jgi:GT2 family glycosyltransferase